MRVIELPVDHPSILCLIREHRLYCLENTPENSGHAVEALSAQTEGIRYFAALDNEAPIGCIGFKRLTSEAAEIKTMHVISDYRCLGIGEKLVSRIIDISAREGFTRLFLETGKSEGFAASRRLYRRLGFEECEPFGAYANDPFSYCMARSL
jgi:putative acetyltransferase